MKKILILLISLYSFVFSYECTIQDGNIYQNRVTNWWYSMSASLSSNLYLHIPYLDNLYSSCDNLTNRDVLNKVNEGNSFYILHHNNHLPFGQKVGGTKSFVSSNPDYYLVPQGNINFTRNDTLSCTDGNILENGYCVSPCDTTTHDLLADGSCVPKCEGTNNYRLADGSCSGCTTEYDASSAANCLCTAIGDDISAQSVMGIFGTHDGKDAVSYNYTCDNGTTFQVIEYIDPFQGLPSDPCITRDGLRAPSGFVFKGEVQSDLECSQYVDIDNYVDSAISPVNSDCETDNNLYCYLKPSLANQDDTGLNIDSNVTFDDGQYIADNIPSINDDGSMPDNNISSDSTKYSNTQLTQINNEIKKLNQTLTNQGEPQINIEIVPTTLIDAIDNQTDVFRDLINDLNTSEIDYTQLLQDEINATRQTNQLLQDDINVSRSIDDRLSMDTTGLQDDVDIEQLGNNVMNDFNLIKSNFEDLKTTLQGGFSFTAPSSTYTPSSANVLGGEITLDLCTPFSNGFRPIITFMITVMGFLLAIKIYIRGLF